MIKVFIDSGEDPNQSCAAIVGSVVEFRGFNDRLVHGTIVEVKADNSYKVLRSADNEVKRVKGSDITMVSLLTCAVAKPSINVAKVLISSGADVNSKNDVS